MSALGLGLLAFVCLFGGAVIGMLVRNTLPDHHLTGDSRDAVKICSGLIATLSALVMALLLTSAKDSFDEMNTDMVECGAKLIILDRTMARYGPETQPLRQELRRAMLIRLNIIWPEHKINMEGFTELENTPPPVEVLSDKLLGLTPAGESQRLLQAEALQLCRDTIQIRWLMFEKSQTALPPIFLGILVFWLTIFFVSIGLLAPRNKTILAVLLICSVSVGGALFLIEEMNRPLSGLVKISSAPLVKAIDYMGQMGQ